MSFQPKFELVDPIDVAIEAAAIRINEPHEPKAVAQTSVAIRDVYNAYTIILKSDTILYDIGIRIHNHMIRSLHDSICWWVNANERGTFRSHPVRIGDTSLPGNYVQTCIDMGNLMNFPIRCTDIKDICDDLTKWYKRFQMIHPFTDGNGQVGGAIVAGISLAVMDRILLPLNETV